MLVLFPKCEEVVGASSFACLEPGVQPVRAFDYYFQSVHAGRWIGTSDLEFKADEPLSGDEVAQAFFVLSGGVVNQACGQIGDFYVEYDLKRPAVLRLYSKRCYIAKSIPIFYC